jgi:hypothetical protein
VTDAELMAKVAELDARATKGPWEASTVDSIGGASIYGDIESQIKQNRRLVASGTWTNDDEACSEIVRPISVEECDANTAFIAAARTLLPEATKRLAAANAEIERLNAVIQDAPHEGGCSYDSDRRNYIGYENPRACNCWKSRVLVTTQPN